MNRVPAAGTIIVEDAILDGLNLSVYCLIGVTFKRCKIRFVNFDGADLSYAAFEDCDLYSSSFVGAVLYTTRFRGCDLTKANFVGAYMNGIRATDVDITHTTFGEDFSVGTNRKPHDPLAVDEKWAQFLPFQRMFAPAQVIESMHKGICCATNSVAIQFIDEPIPDHWRRWRRLSEVAKSVERLMIENGYRDKSLPIYFKGRYYFTRSIQSTTKRIIIILFVELMWGYGIKLVRPVIAWFSLIVFFALAYLAVPAFDPSSGLIIPPSKDPLRVVMQTGPMLNNLYESIYFSSQVSTLSVYGEAKPYGWARALALIQQVVSVLGVGLGTAVLTRRIGNVG